MFGNKAKKRARLNLIGSLLAHSAQGLTQADLAAQLHVTRSTICRDLVALENAGILLAEDDRGRLFWAEWNDGAPSLPT